jgi:hypothetical protein
VTDTPKSRAQDADVESGTSESAKKSDAMREADAANGESKEHATGREQADENRSDESPV